jgi:hypothetical protein
MRSNIQTIIGAFALGLLAVSFAAALAYAEPVSPTSLTQLSSTTRDLSTLAQQSIGAQGGNVTEINIQALTITKSWQGYYGEVTGVITLQDGTNSTFYNWSDATPSGEVYATRSSSVSWTSVNCSTAANVTNEETYLGQAAADADSVSNTFAIGTHPAFAVGGNSIIANTCPRTFGYVNNNTQSTDFAMVLLASGDNRIYTTIMEDSVTGFDGETHDFQLLVGENEKSGSIGATPYYFFVELS